MYTPQNPGLRYIMAGKYFSSYEAALWLVIAVEQIIVT
jgi:hypothetical protein